jgi:hypothetical protein
LRLDAAKQRAATQTAGAAIDTYGDEVLASVHCSGLLSKRIIEISRTALLT